MLEASSLGHAQPKHKTINAEVNLLTEWQRRRNTLLEQIARLAVVLAFLVVLSAASIPFLVHMFAQASTRLDVAKITLKSQSGLLDGLDKQKKDAKPRLDRGSMHEAVTKEAKQFLGQTLEVMNAAAPGMAFQSVTADVIGGEVTIRCKGYAETNAVALAFAGQADEKKLAERSFIPAMQKDPRLGRDGVSFEYQKQVLVGQ